MPIQMAAYYLHRIDPFVFELFNGWGVRWYGLAYVAAFVFGILLYKRLARRGYTELPEKQVSDFILWGALFGVLLGGRLGHVLFYDFGKVTQDPLSFFRVWEGGMASHGGIIGLILFTLWYARRHNLSWLSIGDSLVVVAPVGLFLGRVANFINGELYGRISTVPWAVKFPGELYDDPRLRFAAFDRLPEEYRTVPQVIDAISGDAQVQSVLGEILNPRHPSQIYEALLEGALLFGILWLMRTRLRLPRGVLTGAFMILYALLRIAGEQFREPEVRLAWLGPVTYGQFLSLFLIVIGAAFLIYGLKRRDYERVFRRA